MRASEREGKGGRARTGGHSCAANYVRITLALACVLKTIVRLKVAGSLKPLGVGYGIEKVGFNE